MKTVLLIKDFLLGTQISDRLAVMGKEVLFCEQLSELPAEIETIILDLDETSFGTRSFVAALAAAHPQSKLVGFMRQIQNQRLSELKSAGCSVIISQSAALKNIHTIVQELAR